MKKLLVLSLVVFGSANLLEGISNKANYAKAVKNATTKDEVKKAVQNAFNASDIKVYDYPWFLTSIRKNALENPKAPLTLAEYNTALGLKAIDTTALKDSQIIKAIGDVKKAAGDVLEEVRKKGTATEEAWAIRAQIDDALSMLYSVASNPR